jgi:hypothetical protein
MRSDKHFAKRTRPNPEGASTWTLGIGYAPFESRRNSLRAIWKNVLDCCAAIFPGSKNGHTVPAIETLEKLARALEMPLYQLMFDGDKPPALPLKGDGKRSAEWGSAGKDARFLNMLCRSLAEMREGDRQLLLSFAQNLTKKQRRTVARDSI